MTNVKIELPRPHYDYLMVVLDEHIKKLSLNPSYKERDIQRIFVDSIVKLMKVSE